MPAGNDAHAAASELADRFAAGQARAEDLRAASRAAYPQELREAQMKPINGPATAELDWDKAAKACQTAQGENVEPKSVIDAAVRGDDVVVTFEARDGRTHKAFGKAADAGVETGRRRTRREAEPDDSSDDASDDSGEDETKAKPAGAKKAPAKKAAAKS